MMTQPIPFHIVLFQPEIPPNTGNIIRLCANTGCQLHLIEPFGFQLDEKRLKRAGLDYHEWTSVKTYRNISDFFKVLPKATIYACTTKAKTFHNQVSYQEGDVFIFGPETRGLPNDILNHPRITRQIRIPMKPTSRSLNLSNSVAIITYAALQHLNFPGFS